MNISKKIYLILFLNLIFLPIFSQNTEVKGKIISENTGEPIPSVNISVKNKSIGTVADFNGNFSIKCNPETDTLIFKYIGFQTLEIPLNGKTELDVEMSENVVEMDKVVVTALGIKREKKSLGYAMQEVEGDDLDKVRQVSVINSLSGKVAGLSVSATTGGPASSSRIVLRGNNSFNDNQALIVVDGVPINNSTISNSEDEWGGKDYGNGVSDINPDDIESISVLKGAGAAALYGSKAANGVILISTKKGDKNKFNVSINSGFTISQAYIHKEFQNEFGAGSNGKFESFWTIQDGIPVYNSDLASHYASWGPKMDGQEIVNFAGELTTFAPQPDNYSTFFRTGYTVNNSVTLSTNTKNSYTRITATDLRNSDIIPNSSLIKDNIGIKAGLNILDRINISTYVSFMHQRANNRPTLSDGHTNIPRNYIMMPRSISADELESQIIDENGYETTWYSAWNWMTNPYWNSLHELSFDEKDRFTNNLSANIKFTDNLSLMLRSALDVSNTHFENIGASYGMVATNGHFDTRNLDLFQSNSDFLINYLKNLSSFKIVFSFGGNAQYDRYVSYSASTVNGLVEPYVYSIENSAGTPDIRDLKPEFSAINSLYYLGQISFKEYLFFDFTGRNDWNSTLPLKNNSYFYPSYNFSFVFSELVSTNRNTKNIFPFGKIRFSYAKVGSGTEKYLIHKTYFIDQQDIYGNYGTITPIIPPANLKPEELTSYEAGTDLRFFQNRIGIDFTYYHTNSVNQIVAIDVSSTSGAQKALINAGNIQNNGFELQFNANPVKSKNFNWRFNVNFTKNNSEVIELASGVDNYSLLSHWGLSIEARPGNPYGDIVGYGIQKDENGNKLVDANGYYLRTENPVVLGNVNPDFAMSYKNSFSHKNISFDFLIDAKIGGEMFSGTNMYMHGYSGNAIATLEGREEWYASEAAREEAGVSSVDWIPTGGYVAEGVFADGTEINGEDVSRQTNDIYMNPFDYWHQFADWTNEIHEPFVYDASFVKLREVSLTYNLPQKIIQKIKLQNASFSIVGRNLWLIHSNVPNVDPESFHTNGNGQGYELYAYPTRRNYGFNIRLFF